MTLAAYNFNYQTILRGNFPVNWRNQAIFFNSTFHITPKTDLFVGARYVDYKQDSDGYYNVLAGISATGFPTIFCNGTTNPPFDPADTPGFFASTFIPGQCDKLTPPFVLTPSRPLASKENAWVYNASLTHRFTDDITAYASYGHSWRPRTNNLNLLSNDARITQFATTRSETSNNYEAGLKMAFLDRKLTVNVAAFLQVYNDFITAAPSVVYLDTASAPIQTRTHDPCRQRRCEVLRLRSGNGLSSFAAVFSLGQRELFAWSAVECPDPLQRC